MQVDLNSDMGEGFGDDAALLEIVTSANVACGFHAGSPDIMARTMRAALTKGVGIGAHPGFADLAGFGRKRMQLGDEQLANLVSYQVGAAQAMAMAAGGRLRHLKLHGALANMAAEDQAMAMTCYRAALDIQPDLVIMVIAATAQEKAAQALGATYANEIFADRAYNDDATLVDRALSGAVLHEAGPAADRILGMLEAGAIIAQSGKRIPTRIDTICLHGDTPEAVEMARVLRDRLQDAGVTIRRL